MKRRRPEKNNGLPPGEKLKLNATPQPPSAPWGWVSTEVSHVDEITVEHCLSACNFSPRNKQSHCRNIYAPTTDKIKYTPPTTSAPSKVTQGELTDDVIVISDSEEEGSCSKKTCRANPFCLNYLGQDKWEDEAKIEKRFIDMAKLGHNPDHGSRMAGFPVGLKNLGATCYANASLQVWFRDLAFRSAVYSCEPPAGVTEEKFKDSPVFHLQTTFASLQFGNRAVFNPTRLVESLQLRATEQQDAQEFSKLFMSHLDTEFKKQSSPELQSLIANQFQGNQVYGTICHHCKSKSEHSTDFLEIEVSFNKNCILEDCIEASLAQEVLSGDNRYFCSQCSALQDATRYTELRELPPVLHLSLLRFVYDVSTMERKKSKYSVSFPMTLDMGRFVGPKDPGSEATPPGAEKKHVYELRGILLHKGASAYHGHYEAQVKDPFNDDWFQFNDDVVTQAKGFDPDSDANDITKKSQVKKHRNNARKRRRVDDSDEEERAPVVTGDSVKSQKNLREPHSPSSESLSSRPPARAPERVMSVVEHDNTAHEDACQKYVSRKERYVSRLRELRHGLCDIYTRWEPSSLEDSLVVSRQVLEGYLGEGAIMSALRQLSLAHGESSQDSSEEILHLDDIVCEHRLLDPLKAQDMKVVKRRTISLISDLTKCAVEPLLAPSDVCAKCVASCFQEKLYEIEHPQHVKVFDDVSRVPEDEAGVWISKKWCREWRLPRPRIHDRIIGDLPPDAPEFLSHVHCEHGGLTLNIANRRRISQEASSFLLGLFPSWKPLSADSELCAACEAELHIIKEDKKGQRKQVEEEKACLNFLLEPTLDAWGEQSATCAVLPLHFVRQWKRWIDGHAGIGRPDAPDNSPFLCEHQRLTLDLNCPSDTDSLITIISRSDWDTLQAIYPCDTIIALNKSRNENGQLIYIPDVPTCTDCRLKWKTDWAETEIVVRLQGLNEKGLGHLTRQEKPRVLNLSSRNPGSRQSRRLRQIKENVERRKVWVTKSTTVKEIKITLSAEFSIPTICQRLYYQGKELEDNEATVASLKILANDELDLREAEEVVEIDTDSDDERPPTKRRREEGQGFGGTLLAGGVDLTCSGAADSIPVSHNESKIEKACPMCTFVNVANVVACEMCDSAI